MELKAEDMFSQKHKEAQSDLSETNHFHPMTLNNLT